LEAKAPKVAKALQVPRVRPEKPERQAPQASERPVRLVPRVRPEKPESQEPLELRVTPEPQARRVSEKPEPPVPRVRPAKRVPPRWKGPGQRSQH